MTPASVHEALTKAAEIAASGAATCRGYGGPSVAEQGRDWRDPNMHSGAHDYCHRSLEIAAEILALRDSLPERAVALGDPDTLDWKSAAMSLGEKLCALGPDDYYKFSPAQWLEWAISSLRNSLPTKERHSSPAAQGAGKVEITGLLEPLLLKSATREQLEEAVQNLRAQKFRLQDELAALRAGAKGTEGIAAPDRSSKA